MLKEFRYDKEAMQLFAKGAVDICKPLIATYGPKGREVLLQMEGDKLLLTKSGAAIIQNYKNPDLFLDQGAKLVQEAILNTADHVGDGTTLTAILCKSMIEQAYVYLMAGYSFVDIRKEVKSAKEKALSILKDMILYPSDVKTLQEMLYFHYGKGASILALTEAIKTVGLEGMIQIESSKKVETHVEIVSGLSVNTSKLLMEADRNKKEKMDLFHPLIFISKDKIESFSSLLPVIEYAGKEGKEILFLLENITGEAKKLLEVNIANKRVNATAFKIEGMGKSKEDLIRDICVYTDAKILSKEMGHDYEHMTGTQFPSFLGKAKKISIEKNNMWILCNHTKRVEEYCTSLQEKINSMQLNDYDIQKYQDRIRRLQGKSAIVSIGSDTKLKEKEEIRKVQSALRNIRLAKKNGVIIGGGSALAYTSLHMKEEKTIGAQILRKALEEPFKILCESDGKNGTLKLLELQEKKYPYGYNLNTHDFCDMEQAKILDAYDVVAMAIEQSLSLVSEWMSSAVLMVSTAPDREDLALMKEGVPIMR